jgi:hypothetical protein
VLSNAIQELATTKMIDFFKFYMCMEASNSDNEASNSDILTHLYSFYSDYDIYIKMNVNDYNNNYKKKAIRQNCDRKIFRILCCFIYSVIQLKLSTIEHNYYIFDENALQNSPIKDLMYHFVTTMIENKKYELTILPEDFIIKMIWLLNNRSDRNTLIKSNFKKICRNEIVVNVEDVTTSSKQINKLNNLELDQSNINYDSNELVTAATRSFIAEKYEKEYTYKKPSNVSIEDDWVNNSLDAMTTRSKDITTDLTETAAVTNSNFAEEGEFDEEFANKIVEDSKFLFELKHQAKPSSSKIIPDFCDIKILSTMNKCNIVSKRISVNENLKLPKLVDPMYYVLADSDRSDYLKSCNKDFGAISFIGLNPKKDTAMSFTLSSTNEEIINEDITITEIRESRSDRSINISYHQFIKSCKKIMNDYNTNDNTKNSKIMNMICDIPMKIYYNIPDYSKYYNDITPDGFCGLRLMYSIDLYVDNMNHSLSLGKNKFKRNYMIKQINPNMYNKDDYNKFFTWVTNKSVTINKVFSEFQSFILKNYQVTNLNELDKKTVHNYEVEYSNYLKENKLYNAHNINFNFDLYHINGLVEWFDKLNKYVNENLQFHMINEKSNNFRLPKEYWFDGKFFVNLQLSEHDSNQNSFSHSTVLLTNAKAFNQIPKKIHNSFDLNSKKYDALIKLTNNNNCYVIMVTNRSYNTLNFTYNEIVNMMHTDDLLTKQAIIGVYTGDHYYAVPHIENPTMERLQLCLIDICNQIFDEFQPSKFTSIQNIADLDRDELLNKYEENEMKYCQMIDVLEENFNQKINENKNLMIEISMLKNIIHNSEQSSKPPTPVPTLVSPKAVVKKANK